MKSINILIEIKVNIRNKSQSNKLLKCPFCFSRDECWNNCSFKSLYKKFKITKCRKLQSRMFYSIYCLIFILNSTFLQYKEIKWKGIRKDEICNNYKLSQKMKAISVRENVIGNTVKHRGKGTLSFPLFIFEACRWCKYLK